MNKIETIGRVCPFITAVVHFELNVRWHQARLNGGEVSTDYSRRRIAVGEVTKLVCE
jgi:hypothetical protein